MWLPALIIERVRAVISNEGISHRHDLAAIRRIGQHFLIAGHRSVETNFPDAGAARAKRFALENPAILESENCAHARAASTLPRDFQIPLQIRFRENRARL